MTRHYKIGDVLDVTIQKIVPRGLGLAFVQGLTVLVPLAAPGDELRVSIREIKKRTAFADIVAISRPGPRRVEPKCGLFGKCGGCDMQHLDYTAQLDVKREIVRDCFERLGKIKFEGEIKIIASPQGFGYRSRARWHVDRRRRAFGFYARESHDVVDVSQCPILTPELQSSLEYLRESTDWDKIQVDDVTLEVASDEQNRLSIHSSEDGERAAELFFTVGGETYVFSAEAFFQANSFLIGHLIDASIGDATGHTAIDLYSGVGLFTLPLARRFANVIAVEDNPHAAILAQKNIDHGGIDNVTLNRNSVERFLRENTGKNIDFLLLDPPRAGTAKNVVSAIIELGPSVISYVSCEPSILARDLRALIDAGYRIDSITAVDMFPQTHHVETVVKLSAAAGTVRENRTVE